MQKKARESRYMVTAANHDDHPRDGGGSSRSTRGVSGRSTRGDVSGRSTRGDVSGRSTRGGSSSRHSTPLTPNPIDIRGNLKPSPC